jgi:hypothetical protein
LLFPRSVQRLQDLGATAGALEEAQARRPAQLLEQGPEVDELLYRHAQRLGMELAAPQVPQLRGPVCPLL